jgi:ABC-2 type transport system permease protein
MRLFLHELRAQQRLFWRSRELAFFTFALPVIIYLLLGSVTQDDEMGGVAGADYLLAGMIGYGAISTAFAGLAILLVIRREGGTLKRVRSTPLPPATYIAAVLASFLLVFAIEAAILVGIGRLAFEAHVPERWLSLVLALLLGTAAFAALGVGVAGLVRSAEGAGPVVNGIYLPMSFVSGAFWDPDAFPSLLQRVADVLPLTYFIALVRDVVVHREELWHNGTQVAWLAGWGIAGLIVAIRTFRWQPNEG